MPSVIGVAGMCLAPAVLTAVWARPSFEDTLLLMTIGLLLFMVIICFVAVQEYLKSRQYLDEWRDMDESRLTTR